MVLVALLMAGRPAVADKVDPAVMAMLREWSLTSPSPSRVVICHGFGCAFRTEIALTAGDHAQMAAIMASGSASAQAERAAIGRTEAWFERRIAPITGTARRAGRPAHRLSRKPRSIRLHRYDQQHEFVAARSRPAQIAAAPYDCRAGVAVFIHRGPAQHRRNQGSQDQRAVDGRPLDAQGERSSRYLAARKVEGGRLKPKASAPAGDVRHSC